jgi:hypothetical protein
MRRNDLDVIDATAPLTLKVTQHDIDTATPRDAGACALARCALRQRGVVNVRIGATTAFVQYHDHVERYVIDKADRPRLTVFDKDRYFAPGIYTLLPPPPGRRVGDRVGKGSSGSNVRTGRAANVDRAPSLRGRVSAGQLSIL